MRIFLSYGHDRNEQLVGMIKTRLEDRGHDVWLDLSEVKKGSDWRREITDGIMKSERVMSFLSKHSTRDPGVCLDEIGIAIGVKGGNIQTILVENELDVRPPPSISHIQWLDMHDWLERYRTGGESWTRWFERKFSEILDVLERDANRQFTGEIETLAKFLKPVSSESRIYNLIQKSLVGRLWVKEAINEWRCDASPESNIFWITGGPGVGKSALAAHLVHFGRDLVIAAQFCEYDKPHNSSPHRTICSIAFQVATRLPDYRKFLLSLPEISHLANHTASELFQYLIIEPLSTIIDGNRERYLIVIDALDEAGADGRNALAALLAKDASCLPSWIRIVVTSRPEPSVTIPFQNLKPFRLDAVCEASHTDMRDYVEMRLAAQLRRSDIEVLLDRILEASGGVFLFAELFCDGVVSEQISLDSPEEYPNGLGGIYHQYFERIYGESIPLDKSFRAAFRILVAAIDSLPLKLLQKILEWSSEDLHDFIRPLGSLFPVSSLSGKKTIRAFHKSLIDWLTDADRSGRYYVSRIEGHTALANAAWLRYETNSLSDSRYLQRGLATHLSEAAQWDRLLTILGDAEIGLLANWIERDEGDVGRACLSTLVDALREEKRSPGLLAALTSQLARIESRKGNFEAALLLLNQSKNDAEVSASTKVKAICEHEIGSIQLEKGDQSDAIRHYRRSLAISRRAQPALHKETAANLIALATVFQTVETMSRRAEFLAGYALKMARNEHDHSHALEATRVLADIGKDRSDFDDAAQRVKLGIAESQSLCLPFAEMSLLTVGGWLNYQRAALDGTEPSQSLKMFTRLDQISSKLGHFRFKADAWTGIGQCALYSGDDETLDNAINKLRLLLSAQFSSHTRLRRLLLSAGQLARKEEWHLANEIYIEASRAAASSNLVAREADAMVGQGATQHRMGHGNAARVSWMRALELLPRCCATRRKLILKSIARGRAGAAAFPL